MKFVVLSLLNIGLVVLFVYLFRQRNLLSYHKLNMSQHFLLNTGGASMAVYLHAGLWTKFYGSNDPEDTG